MKDRSGLPYPQCMVPYEFTFNSGYGKESVLYLYICFSDVLIYLFNLHRSYEWLQEKTKVFLLEPKKNKSILHEPCLCDFQFHIPNFKIY